MTWAAIVEITLAGTICIWWECDPVGTTSQYGRGGPTTVLAVAMAATIAGALRPVPKFRYRRRLQVALGVAIAVAATGPGCLALSDLISPKPTGIYLLLTEATIGMAVVATSGIRTGSTTSHPAGGASRSCPGDPAPHLYTPDAGRQPAEDQLSDQPMIRAE